MVSAMDDAQDDKPSELLGAREERIRKAQDQATKARELAGLPPVDDGPFADLGKRRRRKR